MNIPKAIRSSQFRESFNVIYVVPLHYGFERSRNDRAAYPNIPCQ